MDSIKAEDRACAKVVVVVFRAAERPGCLFGFEMDAVEPLDEENPDDNRRGFSDPREWAVVVLVNLDGVLCAGNPGLPKDCEQDGITRG